MPSSSQEPKIKALTARAVRVPMPQPHRTASGVVSESPLVLTDITLDSGVVGRSITFTFTPLALGPTADLIRNTEPLLMGNAAAPAEISRGLAARFRLLGAQGLVGMALAAIDMALWDGLARTHGVSLAHLLGGLPKPTQAYGAIGYDGPAESAKVAEAWAQRGFRGVKAKIGYPTVAEDVSVIRAIRRAAGEEAAVMVDYNQSLTPSEAVERLRILDAEGLTWVEEPSLAHDYAGHAKVAREARTPIQAGENWWGITDFAHALEAGATDFVMADVMKVGGVTGWLEAAALANAHRIRMSNHLWPEISAQLLSVTPTAHWLEYADWWNPILADPLRIKDGMSDPAGVIGSGTEWNEAAVEKFLI
jgi:mandelate racemase